MFPPVLLAHPVKASSNRAAADAAKRIFMVPRFFGQLSADAPVDFFGSRAPTRRDPCENVGAGPD